MSTLYYGKSRYSQTGFGKMRDKMAEKKKVVENQQRKEAWVCATLTTYIK